MQRRNRIANKFSVLIFSYTVVSDLYKFSFFCFSHKVHVGFDSMKGIEIQPMVEDLDDTLQELLAQMGVQTKSLTPETKKKLSQVVEKHGGLERLKTEIQHSKLPSHPQAKATQERPAGTPPPPPPPLPPPPPPPLFTVIEAKDGGLSTKYPSKPIESRSDLMEEIRKGKHLRSIEGSVSSAASGHCLPLMPEEGNKITNALERAIAEMRLRTKEGKYTVFMLITDARLHKRLQLNARCY